jgi:hypothetical protein
MAFPPTASAATWGVVGIAWPAAVPEPATPGTRYMGFMGHSCALPLSFCPGCPYPPPWSALVKQHLLPATAFVT